MICKHRWGWKGRPKERNSFFWKYFQPIESTNLYLHRKSHSNPTFFIGNIQNQRKKYGNCHVGMSYIRISKGLTKKDSLGIMQKSKIMLLLHKLTLGHRIRMELCSFTHAATILVELSRYSPVQKSCKRTALHLQSMLSLQISTSPMHLPHAWNIWFFQSNNGLWHMNL